MKLVTKLLTRLSKFIAVLLVFFFDVHIEFAEIETTRTFAQEAVRTTSPGKRAGADPVKLTQEEAQNGGVLSPYDACRGFVMVPSSDYQKPYWQDRSAGKCDVKTANCQLKVQVIPDGNMFGSFQGVKGATMSSAVTATAFLESVRQDAVQLLTKQISDRETMLNACKASIESAACKAHSEKTKANLAKHEAAFRNAVALLKAPTDQELMRVIVSGDVSPLINKYLRKASGPILTMVNVPKMDPLSSAEFASAEKELKDLVAKAKTEWAAEVEKTVAERVKSGMPADQVAQTRRNLMKEEVFRNKLRRSIAEMQEKKLEAYDKIVFEVPEMPFIGKSQPDAALFVAGQSQVIENLRKAKVAMDKSLKPDDLKSEAKLGEVLQYATLRKVIEAKLEKENKVGAASSCAVATAVNLRLKEVQDRNRLGVAALTIAGVATGGAAGLGLLGAGAVGTGTAIAFASGMIGTWSGVAHESIIKQDLERSANAGLVDAKEVREKVGDITLGVLLAPLDFIGAGAAATSGVLLAKNASRISAAVGNSTLKRFVSAAAATKQLGGQAAAQSDEVVQLLKTLEAAEPGSAKAVEAENRLRLAVNKIAETSLGRKPTADDERAMAALAQGYLGSVDKPLATVYEDYATLTKSMSQADRKAYADRLEAITKAGRGGEVASGKAPASAPVKVEAGLQEANARLALELASEPGYEATAEVMKANSGWSPDAVRNLREVVVSARAMAKGSKEVVSVRFQKALARITGQAEDSPHVKKLACCAGVAACTVAERYPEMDNLPHDSEPVLMACVNLPIRPISSQIDSARAF